MAEGNFYFEQDGDVFHPTPLTRGPWSPNTMHGRSVTGLLAHAAEDRHGDPAFQVSRMTFDLFRALSREPVRVETVVARDGNRIRVVDSLLYTVEDDTLLARSSMVMLRRAAPPEGTVWSPEVKPLPHPDTLEPREEQVPSRSKLKHGWDTRRIANDSPGIGPKQVWIRESCELVAGVPLTPVTRIALVGDLANPFANSGTAGLHYVNADVHVHMVRDPRSDWIGMDTIDHRADAGVAIGTCIIHDLDGPIGHASVCSVASAHQN